MNPRTTYILFAVLVGFGALLLLVLALTSSKTDETTFVLPSLHLKDKPVKESDIDTVIFERNKPGEKKLVFKRDDETGLWRMEEPLALPASRVDSGKVSELVRSVFEADYDKTSDVSGSLAKWGLDNPARVITLKKGDKEWKLFLGQEERTTGGQTAVVYGYSSDLKDPMAIPLRKLLPSLDFGEMDFRSQEVLGPTSDMQEVKLRDGEHSPLVLKRGTLSQWKFVQPDWGAASWDESDATALQTDKKITGVKALLDILAGFMVQVKPGKPGEPGESDFVDDHPTDLAKYGLAGDKLLRIEVARTLKDRDGKALLDKDKKERTFTQTLVIGNKDGDKVFAMLEEQKHVFKVPAANIELLKKLLADPVTLRSRELVAIPESSIDAVTVKPREGEFQLFRVGFGDNWKLYRGDKGDPADGTVVESLLKDLKEKSKIKDFPDPAKNDDKATGLDKPVVVLSLWESGVKAKTGEGDKKPELKDATPNVTLSFGRREGGSVFVKREARDGSAVVTTLVTVPDPAAETVLGQLVRGDRPERAALEFLDKKLPSFSEGNVTQITLERDGQKFVMEKDKGAWKLTSPPELQGRLADANAVADILRDLRSLRANKLLEEKATPELEERYGLKTPATKVTVTTKADDKTEDWTYTFAKEQPDHNVNAKISKSDVIFQINAASIASLQAELRDRSLFTFNKNNVQTMKIQGWFDQFKKPATLEMKRESSSKWVVTSATGGADVLKEPDALDSTKVEDLLNLVLRQKVAKFLDPKKPEPSTTTKLDLKDDALWIEIGVAGEKEGETVPYTLKVGGSSSSPPGWYAQSSVLPGDQVFIITSQDNLPGDQSTSPFTQIRKGAPPKYFGK